MEYSRLIRERYSVRRFSARAVEQDRIDAVLEAARAAPTAANRQPQRILVLRGAESMAKLRDCTPYAFNAPMALAVCCNMDEAWIRSYDGCSAGVTDASIVGAHIMLAAHDLGLGSTWVAHFDPALFRKSFRLPPDIEPVALFPLGYPAPDAKPALQHTQRRPLEEIVVYDSF